MSFDLAVVGAGPAGMAAAMTAAGLGLSVVVLDEQAAPGGQVFRGVEEAGGDLALGREYGAAGGALVRGFRAARVAYQPGTVLWHLDPEAGVLSVLRHGIALEIWARRVLLATGAQERAVPIPGWTLPGVMTAGAAQIVLKTSGAVPEGRVVIGGQGPLAWLLAVQLRRADVGEVTLLETRRRPVLAALPGGGWWGGRRLLARGVGLMLTARRLGVRVVRGVRGLRAEGSTRLAGVAWDGGRMGCDWLLLHEGVVPGTQISQALGLAHDFDAAQQCWRPRLDRWGGSSHPAVAIAGDGGGIGGWEAAVAGGRLAALDAAFRLGRITVAARDRAAGPARREMARALASRGFLERLYAPAAGVLAPPDDATIVCRCEEVTAGAIRAAARAGAVGPNQMKAFLRAGMGACQGRMCGSVVAALIAEVRGVSVAEVAVLRPRAPYKPLTVGVLAGETGFLPVGLAELAATAAGADDTGATQDDVGGL